jgi:hypothetical protein
MARLLFPAMYSRRHIFHFHLVQAFATGTVFANVELIREPDYEGLDFEVDIS